VGRLVYGALASLDGYIADTEGRWDWAEPDEEVHAFVNDASRGAGTYLYGRRLYEVMSFWETEDFSGQPEHFRDFAEIWRAAEKIVYSTTLEKSATARTRIEREFDPDVVRELKEGADGELEVGGANLAAQAFRAGLVDEVRLFLAPVVVGGGKRCLPDDVRLDLELLEERRFGNGTVFLRYAV
jgi:dihydrofolate reductase